MIVYGFTRRVRPTKGQHKTVTSISFWGLVYIKKESAKDWFHCRSPPRKVSPKNLGWIVEKATIWAYDRKKKKNQVCLRSTNTLCKAKSVRKERSEVRIGFTGMTKYLGYSQLESLTRRRSYKESHVA